MKLGRPEGLVKKLLEFDKRIRTLERLSGYVRSDLSQNKYTEIIGNNSDSSITVDHDLGTIDVIVQLTTNATPPKIVNTDVEITSINSVTLIFNSAPAVNEYKVIILK